jgi:uncharacterized protein (DUF488 family)
MIDLFTIGYSSYDIKLFIKVLHNFHISAVVDVRSSPYSQFKSEFNKETIQNFLRINNIAYVFLGDYCGARVEDPSCYEKGKVNYNLVAENQKFQEGLKRIKTGMKKFRIALMCAEKDPITCHRTILICRNLISPEIKIKHILNNGEIEKHKDSEDRLMKKFDLHLPDLFRSEQQRLDNAYFLQGEEIAYKITEPTIKNEDQ